MQNLIFFYILIRHWKEFNYFDRCINSVLNQSFKNYKILFVDDTSGYDIYRRRYIQEKLKDHVVVFNKIRKYSVRNGYEIIHKYCADNNTVILNLDGDDWLIDDNVLKYLADYYSKHPKCLLTYGECVNWDGKKLSKPARFLDKYWNKAYPNKIIRNKSFRKYPFLPLHPRTWRVSLFKRISKKEFLDEKGKWLKFAEDQAFFFPMLEISKGNYKVINKPLYVYNTSNKQADIKLNTTELIKDELIIRRKT